MAHSQFYALRCTVRNNDGEIVAEWECLSYKDLNELNDAVTLGVPLVLKVKKLRFCPVPYIIVEEGK